MNLTEKYYVLQVYIHKILHIKNKSSTYMTGDNNNVYKYVILYSTDTGLYNIV